MKTAAIFAAVILTAAGSAVAQESETYATVNGWSVMRSEDSCSMLTDYEGGSALYFRYNVGKNEVTAAVNDPAFKSIKSGEEYPVTVYFRKPDKLDAGWGEVKAVGLVTETLRAISMTFVAPDFLKDIKASSGFVLMRDNDRVLVTSLSLSGSAAAAVKLEQCAREVHRKNPSDPFAN